MYYLLIICLFAILFINFIGFKEELLCPPTLVSIMFFLCAVFGLVRVSDWRFSDYSIETVGILLCGIISFTIFGFIGYKIKIKYSMKVFGENKDTSFDRIELNGLYIFLSIIIGVGELVLFLLHIRRCLARFSLGYSSLSSFLLGYYQLKTYHSVEVTPVGLVKYIGIISNVNALFCIYVFMHNLMFKHNKKKDFLLLFVISLYILHSLFDSSRGEMMLLIAEAFYLFYFFMNVRYNWSTSSQRKIFTWMIRIFVIMIVGFLALSIVMGRRDSIAEIDVAKYLSTYMSSGIRNLDLFVQRRAEPNSIFGKETFYAINRFLYNRFGIGELYDNALEFASINDGANGNIYTAFRRFYADFGILGVIIIPGVLGFGFTYAYKAIRTRCMHGEIDFGIIMFSVLSTELFFMPIEERFFTVDFSVNGLLKMILLYILYVVMIKRKKRVR